MTTADNALQTTTQRQMGINQPRPEATLHVGGTFIADGLATFRGGLSTGGGALTLDSLTVGTLTVTGGATFQGTVTMPTLNVTQVNTSGLTVTGNVSVSGNTSTGSLNISTGGMDTVGRAAFRGTDTLGVATAAGSSGIMEIQPQGGGAAKIAFHRPGAYATYLGIDTDNVLRIGGWSLGAAAYRILDDRDYSTEVTGSKLVQRTPEGYIKANYINTSADVSGGRPVYVAGNNGDGYLRWWPIATIGPPSSPILLAQAWSIDGTSYDGYTTYQVSLLNPDRVGNWYIMLRGNGRSPNGPANDYFMDIDGVGRAYTGSLDGEGSGVAVGTLGLFNGPYLIGPGNYIRTYANHHWGYMNGTSYALFVPVQGYPN